MKVVPDAPVPLPTFPSHLRILQTLGEGGTAVVYEGFHERLRVPVAIKVLRAFGYAHAEARQRLRREAELCARLHNPRVPRIYDVDTLPEGTPYLVMELIRGTRLDTLISAQGLRYEDAAWLLGELLDALEALHGAGIVHRDVKPENLLLSRSEQDEPLLRLIDFGVAKVLADMTSPRLTGTGTLVGTPQYIAPEVLLGQTADKRADIYAAAVTFFELLAGRPPFDDSSVGAALAASLRDDPLSLCALRPDLSPDVERLVARGMARDPRDRFGSAREMRAALDRARGTAPGARAGGAPALGAVELAPRAKASEPHARDSGILLRNRRRWTGIGWAAAALLTSLSLGAALKSQLSPHAPSTSRTAASAPDPRAGVDHDTSPSAPPTAAPSRAEPYQAGFGASFGTSVLDAPLRRSEKSTAPAAPQVQPKPRAPPAAPAPKPLEASALAAEPAEAEDPAAEAAPQQDAPEPAEDDAKTPQVLGAAAVDQRLASPLRTTRTPALDAPQLTETSPINPYQ